ncbi:hypothetical protein Leryth_008991 [Lithospermum erythrorhizon]|nr:hypothetical protein Leryth_008991 [Lithospermum erythrorhizon]
MVGEVRLNNTEGGVSNGNMSVDLEGKEICSNGFVTASKNGTIGDVYSAGSSGNILRTYKRRRRTKTMEDEKLTVASSGHVNDQSAKEQCYKNLSGSSYMQSRLSQMGLHACVNDAKGCSTYWRNVVLEQMSQTLECEGGLRGCIQEAVAYDLQSCRTAAVKGPVHSCEKESKYTSQTGPTLNNLHNEVCRNEGIGSNRPMQEPKSYTGKELCQHTFYEVIRSEKFAQLCHLLLKSFPGIISERVLDVSSIDSKMEAGAYENSPNLFHADIQQVWTKIEQIGTDMVALAKSLSVISRVSFCEQAGSVSLCSTEVGKPDVSSLPLP